MDLAKVTEHMVGGNWTALVLFLSSSPRLYEAMGPSSVVSCLHLFFFSFLDLLPALQLQKSTHPHHHHIFLHVYFSLLSPCFIQPRAPNLSTQIAQTKVRKSLEGPLLEVSASIHRKGDLGVPSSGCSGITLLLVGPVRGPITISLATSTQWRRAGRGKCFRKNSSLYTHQEYL